MKISISNLDLSIDCSSGETLLEGLLKNDIPIDHSCDGMGSCGTCRVIVEEGLENLHERNEIEQERADALGFSKRERLSCQMQPSCNLKINIPE